jgi:hypothetical protein
MFQKLLRNELEIEDEIKLSLLFSEFLLNIRLIADVQLQSSSDDKDKQRNRENYLPISMIKNDRNII